MHRATRRPRATWGRALLLGLISLSTARAYYFGAAYTDSVPEDFDEDWEPEWRDYQFVDRCLPTADANDGKISAFGIISGAFDPYAFNRPGHRLRGMIFYKSRDCTVDATDQFVVFTPQRDVALSGGRQDFYRGVQVVDLANIDGVDMTAYNSYQEVSASSGAYDWVLMAAVPTTEGRAVAFNLNNAGIFEPGASTGIVKPDAGTASTLALSLEAQNAEPVIGRLRIMLQDIAKTRFRLPNQQLDRLRVEVPLIFEQQVQNRQDPGQSFSMNLGMLNSNLMNAMQRQAAYQSLPQILPRPGTQAQTQSQVQQPQLQPVQQNPGQQMNLGMFNSNPLANFGTELLNPGSQSRGNAPLGTRLNALDQGPANNPEPFSGWPGSLASLQSAGGSLSNEGMSNTASNQRQQQQPGNMMSMPQIQPQGNMMSTRPQGTGQNLRPFTVIRNTRVVPEQRPQNTFEELFSNFPTDEQLREFLPRQESAQPRLPINRIVNVLEEPRVLERFGDPRDEGIAYPLRGFRDMPTSPTLRWGADEVYGGPPRLLSQLDTGLDRFLQNPPVQRQNQFMAPQPRTNANNNPNANRQPVIQDPIQEEGLEDEQRRFPFLSDDSLAMEIENLPPPDLELDLYDFSDLPAVNADYRTQLLEEWSNGRPILGDLMELPINTLDPNWAAIETTRQNLLRDIEEEWVPYLQSRWAAQEASFRDAYNGLVNAYADLENRNQALLREIRTTARAADRLDPQSVEYATAEGRLTRMRLERNRIADRQDELNWKSSENDALRQRKKRALEAEYRDRVRDVERRYQTWKAMAEINIDMQATRPTRVLRDPRFGSIPN